MAREIIGNVRTGKVYMYIHDDTEARVVFGLNTNRPYVRANNNRIYLTAEEAENARYVHTENKKLKPVLDGLLADLGM